MKALISFLFALAALAAPLSAHPVTLTQNGFGLPVALKANVPMRVDFPNANGCAILKFAGGPASTSANVTMFFGGKNASGPASSVRSIVYATTPGPQWGTLLSSANTTVYVFFYDYKPRTTPASRGKAAKTSCFS